MCLPDLTDDSFNPILLVTLGITGLQKPAWGCTLYTRVLCTVYTLTTNF